MADMYDAPEVKPVLVNATGLSCPQPVMLTKKALSEHEDGCVVVLVDTATSKNNVTRFAENKGWKVVARERGGDKVGWKVIMTK